jgi:hypothetical protein
MYSVAYAGEPCVSQELGDPEESINIERLPKLTPGNLFAEDSHLYK